MTSRAEFRQQRLDAAAKAQVDAALKSQARADAFVQQFTAMTPAQVDAYIDANVTTVAGARALLKKMALMLLLIARREYGD